MKKSKFSLEIATSIRHLPESIVINNCFKDASRQTISQSPEGFKSSMSRLETKSALKKLFTIKWRRLTDTNPIPSDLNPNDSTLIGNSPAATDIDSISSKSSNFEIAQDQIPRCRSMSTYTNCPNNARSSNWERYCIWVERACCLLLRTSGMRKEMLSLSVWSLSVWLQKNALDLFGVAKRAIESWINSTS